MTTDQQAEALRAYLTQDFDGYRRISGEFNDTAWDGYGRLLGAAFFEAVNDAFGQPDVPEIIRWVAEQRAEFSDADAAEIDPTVAERLIRAALGDGDVDDLDSGTLITTQTLLLPALVNRAGKSADDIVARSRALANSWGD